MLGVPSLPSLEYPFCFSSVVLRGESGPEGFLRPLDDGLDMKAAEFSDESELDDFCSMRSLSFPFPLPWPLGPGPVTFCNRLAALEAKSRGSPRNVALGSVYWPLPSSPLPPASMDVEVFALKGKKAGSASSSSS